MKWFGHFSGGPCYTDGKLLCGKKHMCHIPVSVDHNPMPSTPRGFRRMRNRGYTHPDIPAADSPQLVKDDPWKKYATK